VSQREFLALKDRHCLGHLLQEARVELASSAMDYTSAASAEREAASRAMRERRGREDAEDRAEAASAECAKLREEIDRLGGQLKEAAEGEGKLRDLLERFEEARAKAARREAEAGDEVARVRTRLVEKEQEVRVLASQVMGVPCRVRCVPGFGWSWTLADAVYVKRWDCGLCVA